MREFGTFVVNIPELELLKQYHGDSVSWVSRFKNILLNSNEREDQENVVEELKCIQTDGSDLKVQGWLSDTQDYLPFTLDLFSVL